RDLVRQGGERADRDAVVRSIGPIVVDKPLAFWQLIEMRRERILYVVVLFAALLVASSCVLTPLAPGAQKKVVADFGLAAIDLLGILVILLAGSALVRREMDRRSLDILLSKPLTRLEYLSGKCLGLMTTLLVLTGAMTLLFAVALEAAGFGWRPAYLTAVLGSLLEMLVVAGIAVLFSTFTSPILAAVFTLMLFVAGHLSETMLRYVHATGGSTLFETLSLTVPALGLFNLRGEAVHGVPIPAQRLVVAVAYAGLYTATVLYLAALVFRRRDFR
ncbi:MAG: ABC transporter permease, partial [Candidatus Krumholzibacteriia bacterium]